MIEVEVSLKLQVVEHFMERQSMFTSVKFHMYSYTCTELLP